MDQERRRQFELVKAAQQGDVQAGEQLYQLTARYLRRHFFSHARRCYGPEVRDILEDIEAEAMKKSFEKLDRFTGERARFTTWVFGFAKNVLRSHYNKQKRRNGIWVRIREDDAWWNRNVDKAAYFGCDPLKWLLYQEKVKTLEAVRRAMQELPGDYQTVLDWVVVKQKQDSEAARRLSLPEAEVGELKQRGLALLRERFFRHQYGTQS